MPERRLLISKSRYLNLLQCPKLFWKYLNARGEIPAPDAATQAIFDQGHEVGELAKRLFLEGIEVGKGVIDPKEVDGRSREALVLRKPLYEAGFIVGNAFARADILVPVEEKEWDLYEVKSSTEVKEVNLHDLAFQWHTYREAGVGIRRAFLVHINNGYVRQGEIEPDELFTRVDCTEEIRPKLRDISKKIAAGVELARERKVPDVPIGPHCSDPYECPLRSVCWKFLPKHNVFTLHRLGVKGFSLLEEGVVKIADIPDGFPLTNAQKIQRDALTKRTPYIDAEAIRDFLSELEYPLYFLDFETFGTAIPLFDGVRPYQQVPFQYSLHIQQRPGGKLEHKSFLSEGTADPVREILSRLKRELGETGSIVAYNASFEKGRMDESCEAHPEYRAWWRKTKGRIVDLITPFRRFHYYHPAQEGSASLKSVLPALTGRGYEGLAIADGGTASLEFLRVTFGDASTAERKRVRKELEEYCGLDTFAMVHIVDSLREQVQ